MASQIVGYKYSFGIHMGIGRGPVDELCQIKVGDRTAWAGSVKENTTVSIDKPNLFGGDAKEGGIVGTLDVMMGGPTQVAPNSLKAMLGNSLPGFRRVFTAFYNGVVSTNNPYPKSWKFRQRRALQGWDGPVFLPDYAVIKILAEEVPSDMEPEEDVVVTGTYTEPPAGWIRVQEDGTGSSGGESADGDGSSDGSGDGAGGDGSE